MAEYSPSTASYPEKWQLRPITLFFLREHEVAAMEKERPGSMLAWREICRRGRPDAPSVPLMFKPEAWRRAVESINQSRKGQRRAAPCVPKAWAGLPASAHGATDQACSDKAKRLAAAQRALELAKAWPHGDHARARADMEAEDLLAFEKRFVDTF